MNTSLEDIRPLSLHPLLRREPAHLPIGQLRIGQLCRNASCCGNWRGSLLTVPEKSSVPLLALSKQNTSSFDFRVDEAARPAIVCKTGRNSPADLSRCQQECYGILSRCDSNHIEVNPFTLRYGSSALDGMREGRISGSATCGCITLVTILQQFADTIA